MNGERNASVSYIEERYENPSIQEETINESNVYNFRTLPNKNIGIIEFNACWNLDRFTLFLDSAFKVLQKEDIGNLIIDIRRNGGGDSDLGDELFQYISPVPFAQFGKTIVRYSDKMKQAYKNYGWEPPKNPNGIEVYGEDTELIKLERIIYDTKATFTF